MSDEEQFWEGYRLNPDGTIAFEAIVDYGILTVPTGVVMQFFSAASQEAIDAGQMNMVQLHMGPHHLRECAEEMLRAADAIGA